MYPKFLPRDTTLEAARFRYSVLRRLSPAERLEMAFELSDAVREALIAGIRHRHPDYTPRQVRREVLRLTLGKDLFEKYEPHIPPEEPGANTENGRNRRTRGGI